MEVAGTVEVLDEDWALVMGIEITKIRNQLVCRKWRVLRQDGELINTRLQPPFILEALRLLLGSIYEGQGAILASGALTSSLSRTRDPQVVAIDRHPILRPGTVFSYFCTHP